MNWFTVIFATLIEGLSAFGRSSAISPFLGALCQDLSLSKVHISGAYSLGYLAAGLVLPFLGRIYDRVPLCYFLQGLSGLFGVIWLSFGWGLSALASHPFGCWIGLMLGFIGIRICIQAYGVVRSALIASGWNHCRGLVTACSALIIALIASVYPYFCYQASQRVTWQSACLLFGGLWLLFLIPARWTGKPITPSVPSKRFQASRIGTKGILFYSILFILGFKHFQESGIAFHLVSMCKEFGVDARLVSASFISITVLSIGVSFIAPPLFRHLGARFILLVFLLSDLGMLYGLHCISKQGMLTLFIVCSGIYWGIHAILTPLVIPSLFNEKKLGALQGAAYAAMSLGSALGPFYFAWMEELYSYQMGLKLCLLIAFLMPLMGLFIKPTSSSPEV